MTDSLRQPKRRDGILLWGLAAVLTMGCFAYQDKTGPTYPLEGTVSTTRGDLHFKFLRSQSVGQALPVAFLDPVPEGVTGFVEYRRYRSDDSLERIDFATGTFEFVRRGRSESATGQGAELPTLQERAGKYEFFVWYDDGTTTASITGEAPVFARFKGAVPRPVLMLHILAIFFSMTIALRAVFEALRDGSYRGLIWATIVSLLVGGFVLGPWVQWYAFGVWWSGIPYGHDWTDNKVLVELVFWLAALWLNRGARRSRIAVYVAGLVTLAVYFIPHSVFGSEFDYRTGTGHGTAG